MMDKGILMVHEKKNKNKARKIAILVHALLVLGFAVPFLNSKIQEPAQYEQVIAIEFEDFQSAAAKSSTRKASPAATKAVEAPKPVTQPTTPTPPKPEVKKTLPKPTPPVAKHKPVIVTPEPAPPIRTAPTKKDVPVKAPKPEPVKVEAPSPEPVKVKAPAPEPVKVEAPSPEPAKVEVAEAPAPSPAENAPGSLSEAGEGDSGSSETGNAETDGKAEKGDSGDDFSGSGLLTRRVVYRANVKELTKEEGKIVINICVSQQGTVTFSQYNAAESTINNADLIVKAKKTASKYKFEKDYTAPRKQCGKLTFVFSIDD